MAKKPADPRGGHVRIYWEVVDSMAWRALNWSSVGLYIAMRRKLLSTNNGNLSCTMGDMKHYGMASSATLAKALKALQAVGLISMTRQGGIAFGQKVCSLYRFTDEQVFEQPKVGVRATAPTHEWRQFTTLGQAKAAIHAAHATTKNASGLQKLKRIGSKNEASARFVGSVSEAVSSPLVQELNQSAGRQSAATPHKH